MGRKWLRKLVCEVCKDPISAGTVCGSCKAASAQDNDDQSLTPTRSNFQKMLAEGFKTLYMPYSDGLDD